MSKRWITITAWLVAGHAILGGLYWLLLQVPESNVLMLTASVLVVMGGLAWMGFVESVGIRGLSGDGTVRSTLAAGVRRAAWILPALVVFIAMWLLTGFAGNWLAAHRGENDAWLMLKFGWTETQGLHCAVSWLLWFVRYGIGLSLSVALLAGAVCRGAAGVFSLAWLARAFNWKAVLVTTAALWIGIWVPWHFVEWRPESLPDTWVQPVFATTKLLVFFVVMNVGWAVVLWWAARKASPVATRDAAPIPAAPTATMSTGVPSAPMTTTPAATTSMEAPSAPAAVPGVAPAETPRDAGKG